MGILTFDFRCALENDLLRLRQGKLTISFHSCKIAGMPILKSTRGSNPATREMQAEMHRLYRRTVTESS